MLVAGGLAGEVDEVAMVWECARDSRLEGGVVELASPRVCVSRLILDWRRSHSIEKML